MRHENTAWIAAQRTRIAGATIAGAILMLAGASTASAAPPSYLKGYEKLYAQDAHAAALAWFRDAKFGLFVHYALASVLEGGKPEFVELTKGLEDQIEWSILPPSERAALGVSEESLDPVRRLQRDLMKRFRAERFDANAICDLAADAQMRYVTFTTKHLGRMAMYRTKTSDFTSLAAPAGRDLVEEMAEACARRGLGLFLYVPPETARTDGEFFQRNRTILRELLTQYGPIAGIWFDGIGDFYRSPEHYTRLSELFALVRRLQPQCLISFKEGAVGEEDFITPEHFLLPTPVAWDTPQRQERWNIRLERWKRQAQERWERSFKTKPAEINTTMQECRNRDGVGAPGGWINDETARHLSADEVMRLLAVARKLDANLLLNIGPRGDGSIHPDDAAALREVGRRIRRNGFPDRGKAR